MANHLITSYRFVVGFLGELGAKWPELKGDADAVIAAIPEGKRASMEPVDEAVLSAIDRLATHNSLAIQCPYTFWRCFAPERPPSGPDQHGGAGS